MLPNEAQKIIKTVLQKMIIVFLAAFMIFLLHDLMEAFAEAFIPDGKVKIQLFLQEVDRKG